MDTLELKQWFFDKNIEAITKDSFWKYFLNLKDEDIYGFEDTFGDIDERLIKIKISKVQLTHILEYGDFIYSLLEVFLMENYIGEYKLVFTIEGDIEDDILKLEPSSYIKKLTAEANRSIQIAKKCLEENLNSELIAKITELELEYINKLKDELWY